MTLASLDHVTISTNDLEACRRFYCEVLGLEEGFRPSSPTAGFGVPGLWLYVGGQPVIHIIAFEDDVGKGSQTVHHFAFNAHKFDAFKARLDKHGVKYMENNIPEVEFYQLFFLDPQGIRIEVNFVGMDRPLRILQAEGKLEPVA